MTKQQTIEDLERRVQMQGDKLVEQAAKVEKLKEENQQLREELAHYRTAVAAVKWLWDQAQQVKPFQL